MRDRALKQGHRAAAEQPREKKVLINIFFPTTLSKQALKTVCENWRNFKCFNNNLSSYQGDFPSVSQTLYQ